MKNLSHVSVKLFIYCKQVKQIAENQTVEKILHSHFRNLQCLDRWPFSIAVYCLDISLLHCTLKNFRSKYFYYEIKINVRSKNRVLFILI